MKSRLDHAVKYAKKLERGPRRRWVYFVKCGEFYKVGIADNVKARLHSLQCASPYQIELVKAWQCADAAAQERAIHGLLWRYHERGEWFKLPIEIVLCFGIQGDCPIDALKQILK